jgi:hypothetical protein
MKQNSILLAAMAKGNGGGGSGGGGGGGGSGYRGGGSGSGDGGGGGSGNRCRDQGTKAMCPNYKLAVQAAADCFTLPANKDKISTWYKPPKLD